MTVSELSFVEPSSNGETCGEELNELLRLWVPFRDPKIDAEILVKCLAPDGAATSAVSHVDLGKVLATCVDDWTALFRPYFTDALQSSSVGETSSIIREQLCPLPSSHTHKIAIWDNACSWRQAQNIRDGFAWCMQQLPDGCIDKFERAGKVVPFIVHISEDYEVENRLVGARCIKDFLRVTKPSIVLQMQLDAMFRQTLRKNISFDDVDLKSESFACLLRPPLINLQKSDEQQVEWLEELLDLCFKETFFAKEPEFRAAYLKATPSVISALGVASVCRIKATLAFLLDIPLDETSREGVIQTFTALLDNAWPRLGSHRTLLKQVLIRIKDHCDYSEQSRRSGSHCGYPREFDRLEERINLL